MFILQWIMTQSEGNLVYNFQYIRIYSEITNIIFHDLKLPFYSFVLFSKLQILQVKYLPDLLIVSLSTET